MSIPSTYHFGQGLDWASLLIETSLYVELPFWLMVRPGPVDVSWAGVKFTVEICPPWIEVFVGSVTDSRSTRFYSGARPAEGYEPPEPLREELRKLGDSWIERHCKTVLRMAARAHADVFRDRSEGYPSQRREQEAYFASLCEAHLPVVNELIQRYRLLTYDPFAYEVSAWDVPIWVLNQGGAGYGAVIVPYKEWDAKPVTVEAGDAVGDPNKVQQFEWASLDDLTAAASSDATPGEFDLLDARSLMERGDYSGAVRRTTTAIETIVSWVLSNELQREYGPEEAARRLKKTVNSAAARYRQWRELPHPLIGEQLLDEFEATRNIRHEIVHEGRRITLQDRGLAQRAVDTGRWLYNKIEAKPERARLRDYGVLKHVGRVALAHRFPATVEADGITIRPHW
jgi:hypothetical protein